MQRGNNSKVGPAVIPKLGTRKRTSKTHTHFVIVCFIGIHCRFQFPILSSFLNIPFSFVLVGEVSCSPPLHPTDLVPFSFNFLFLFCDSQHGSLGFPSQLAPQVTNFSAQKSFFFNLYVYQSFFVCIFSVKLRKGWS